MRKCFVSFLILCFGFTTLAPSLASAATHSINTTYEQTSFDAGNAAIEQPQISTFFWGGWIAAAAAVVAKWVAKLAVKAVEYVVKGFAGTVGSEAGKDAYRKGKEMIKG